MDTGIAMLWILVCSQLGYSRRSQYLSWNNNHLDIYFMRYDVSLHKRLETENPNGCKMADFVIIISYHRFYSQLSLLLEKCVILAISL